MGEGHPDGVPLLSLLAIPSAPTPEEAEHLTPGAAPASFPLEVRTPNAHPSRATTPPSFTLLSRPAQRAASRCREVDMAVNVSSKSQPFRKGRRRHWRRRRRCTCLPLQSSGCAASGSDPGGGAGAAIAGGGGNDAGRHCGG